jgi:predicted NAD-dependent protein-ADP-ribosyltransferase YbiA (DUF1768 family)
MTNPNVIDSFRGEFAFLSNFYSSPIRPKIPPLVDLIYPSVEHAYQAAKTNIPEEIMAIHDADVRTAKKLGKTCTLRPEWDDWFAIRIMSRLVRLKFQHPTLQEKLLLTDGFELIEGNWWNDKFWGVCDGVGENNLGQILMKTREYYKQKRSTVLDER